MRKIFIVILFFISQIANAATYYVATTGSDGGTGAIGDPWATWGYAWTQLSAGDILYIRGGRYDESKSAGTSEQIQWYNLDGSSGNWVTIQNYPGETVIMDFSSVTHTPSGVFGLMMANSSYIHVKGIRITRLYQSPTSAVEGFAVSGCDSVIIENCTVDSIGGSPFTILHTTNSIWLNCDASASEDPFGNYEGANGFQCTSNINTSDSIYLTGCRAWWICDDGFDFFGLGGHVFLNNCWSFWNGYEIGSTSVYVGGGADGNGFKTGPGNGISTDTLRQYSQCIAVHNYATGFIENYNSSNKFPVKLVNNTAYDNDYGMYFANGDRVHIVTNNIAYDNATSNENFNAEATETTNSWQVATVTDADFLSVSSSGIDGARGSGGSLPDLTFLHLATGSDLIGTGTEAGYGTDLGAFPYVAPSGSIFYLFFF